MHTLEGHKGWVLYVAFAPDGQTLASAGMDHCIHIWDANTGKQIGRPLKGHKNYITSLAWEPLVKMTKDRRMASSSKDCQVRIWDTIGMNCLRAMSSHTASVTKVLWGGEDLLYSASQDRTIKVWNPDTGANVNELTGHAHWVNCLALSTDYVLRTGCFDHTQKSFDPENDQQAMKAYA
jgi:ribosome assembly protein 4